MSITLKHGTLLACLLLLSRTSSEAQFVKGFGLKGGPVSTTQSWDYSSDQLSTEARWGIDIGMYLEVIEHPILSILAEVHYVQKGFSERFPPLNMAVFPDRLDYLSFPVLVKLRYDAETVAPYIVGGPRIEFLLNTDAGVETITDANSIGLGISVGGGLEVPISNLTILTEVIYSPSLDDVYSNRIYTVSNESVHFLIGLRL